MVLRHIFVVDDDTMTANLVRDHLENNLRNRVTVFNTGEECIKNLHFNPDVIILDYRLNNVIPTAADGLHILGQIKKLDKKVTVIMLSAVDEYSKAVQTLVNGANEYVLKDETAFKRIDRILGD